MKTLTKLALVAALIGSTLAAQAEWVNGYTRKNGTYVSGHYRSSTPSYGSSLGSTSSSRDYVYRNPYAAFPSERVSGYARRDGGTVMPYYRTPANNTITDNLSYRGFGTIKVPRTSGW
jgi:hypothetical protein